MSNNKPYKILSCDGGGIRGLLTVVLLERLENKLGSKLADHFDMFAGTSTGSIIACALSKGMSASTIKNLYLQQGKTIFPEMNWEYWLENTVDKIAQFHASLPFFKADGLEHVLQSSGIFPPSDLFGNLPKTTLVVSYDAYNRTAVVFKSNKQEFNTIPVWEVCRSSSAAPVAFPGYFLTNANYISQRTTNNHPGIIDTATNIPIQSANYTGKSGFPLIDGGVVANNPALCALAERISLNKDTVEKFDLSNIILASFGTGQSKHRISPEHVETWGGLAWVNLMAGIPLMDVFSDGSADVIDYISIQMIGDNYYRFQPLLLEGISTFQADDKNLEKLVESANNYLKNDGGDAYLDTLVSQVK